MSVYTELSEQDFQKLLSQYDLGTLVSYQGIAAGIENTNYKVTLKKAEQESDYFLTIFEQLSRNELDFFIPLLAHLKQNGCHVAGPKAQISGHFVMGVYDKPAALFDCLSGYHVEEISGTECFAIGAELARIHLAAHEFPQTFQNPRGFYWLQKQISNQALTDNEQEKALLEDVFNELQNKWGSWQDNDQLPKGFIHGDLFADNCLFEKATTVNGVIDFYAGGHDYWVYDLAITILAWCAEGGGFNQAFQTQLIAGYQSIRPLTAEETSALPDFIKLATLRFWVSRLIAAKSRDGASLTTIKDPNFMKRLLIQS